MFEINTNHPSFPISKNTKLSFGDIVQLMIEDNMVVLTKSDGTAPIGFVTSINGYVNQDRDRATIIFTRFYGQSDQYETTKVYPTNANLYVSEDGLLTTNRPSGLHPSVGLVVQGPSPINSALQFLWL